MKHLCSVTRPRNAFSVIDYWNLGYCFGFAKAEPKREGGPDVPEACASVLGGKIKFGS